MDRKLEIECEEMVAMPVGNGFYQNIIFKPTPATVDAIKAAIKDGEFYDISVADGGGKHTSNRLQRLTTAKHVRSVIIVTSEEI